MAIYKNSPPDTYNFLQATGITDMTQIRAVSTLVTDLKYAGIWGKMKAIYPFVGGTATTHKFNLKDPRNTLDAYVITFGSGWTHSSTGVLPNGTINGTATFGIIPSRDLTDSSVHASVYSRTNVIANQADLGTFAGAPTAFTLYIRWGDGTFYNDLYDYNTNRVAVANSDSRGFYIISRESTTSQKSFKNGTQVGTTNVNTSTSARTSLTNLIYFGGRSDGFYSTKEYAFMSIGDGLSNTESLAYYTAVQKFQTSLGRQV